jgi:hypothetical protein
MHLYTLRTFLLAATVVLGVGCPPPASEPADGGGSGGAGGGGGGGLVTYTKDVQPIFKAKCAPCHTVQSVANQNIATNYADVNKPVEAFEFGVCWNDLEQTMPKKVGECALLLVNSGRMPMGAGCANDPPSDPALCLTTAEKATVAAWVAAGMPQ